MKKTIVIIILAVYVASIAVVNFFGLEIKQYDGETYVDIIEVRNVTHMGNNGETMDASGSYPVEDPLAKDPNNKFKPCYTYAFEFIPSEDGEPYTRENVDTNRNMLQIDYMAISDKGETMAITDKMIEFVYDENSGVAVYDEDMQALIFLKPDQWFTLRIKSTDAKGAWTEIKIKAISPAA